MTTTPTPLKQSYPSISWIVSSLHSNVYNSFIKKKMTINVHTCSDHFHRTRASTMHGATDVNQPSLKVSMKALWLTAWMLSNGWTDYNTVTSWPCVFFFTFTIVLRDITPASVHNWNTASFSVPVHYILIFAFTTSRRNSHWSDQSRLKYGVDISAQPNLPH